MSRRIRRWLIRFVLVLVGLTVLIVISHFILLFSGKGITITVAGVPILRLGTSTESEYPQQIESAFEKKYDRLGQSVRIPKYIEDTFVNSETDGVITATVVNTQSQRRYRFQSYTSYICAAPNMVHVGDPNVSITPQKNLANYVFEFHGDNYRGNLMPDAINNFRQDLNTGDPAKLYLLRPTPDKDGTYPLVHVILFTSNASCVNTSFNGNALPDASVTPNAK